MQTLILLLLFPVILAGLWKMVGKRLTHFILKGIEDFKKDLE